MQFQVDLGPQHKTRYTKSHRRGSGKYSWYIDTGENFLKRTSMAHALRYTVDKRDLMKLKTSVRQRALSIQQ